MWSYDSKLCIYAPAVQQYTTEGKAVHNMHTAPWQKIFASERPGSWRPVPLLRRQPAPAWPLLLQPLRRGTATPASTPGQWPPHGPAGE